MKKESDIIKKNSNERIEFVTFWANYVRTHSDKLWSKQQNVLINSQLKSSMTREQYLAMKSSQ